MPTTSAQTITPISIACSVMPRRKCVRIRRSKTNQEGQGQEVAIPRGYKLRPVEAVQTWLAGRSTGRPVSQDLRVSFVEVAIGPSLNTGVNHDL